MTAFALTTRNLLGGLWLPGVLLCGLVITVLAQVGIVRISPPSGAIVVPEIVSIAPRGFGFRQSGEFVRDGRPVDAPLLTFGTHPSVEIMKYQVSATEYARCVRAAVCRPAEPRHRGVGDIPVTGVSYNDAVAYASWLSDATGSTWRLPTMEEWAFAAGSKEIDHSLDAGSDADNPAARWLLTYDNETASAGKGFAAPAARGTFGANEFGVADLAGTVWEWTSTCASRTTLGGENATRQTTSCRIHYLEGRHRAPINDFMRDASGGGCGGGKPPDNLGFRLVRDHGWLERSASSLRAILHI